MKVYHLGTFPEIVKGVAMAKCSRSTNTFLQDAQAVSVEKAEDFNERVVAGYGHESVAEMAIGSPVLEDVSMLVAETFLDIQTGHYQGKSSRYVVYKRENTYNPFHSGTTEHLLLTSCINNLFNAYETLYQPLMQYVGSVMPAGSNAVKNARVLDALRGLLPLACKTNFGSRLTGRDISRQVRNLLSSKLEEAQQLGLQLKQTGINELGPALVKYADAHPLLTEYQNMEMPEFDGISLGERVTLECIGYDQEAEVVRALMFELTGQMPSLSLARARSTMVLNTLNRSLAKRVRRQDPLPRCLRAAKFRFEIVADFGAWKDLRRHRRNELYRTGFSANLGFDIPDDLLALPRNLQELYKQAMDFSTQTYEKLYTLGYTEEAQYAVAQGHLQRWVVDLDLEQLYYICELRTAPQGHISYRRVARDMYERVKETHPVLVQHMLVHPVDGIGDHT